MTIGERIRKVREKAELSQTVLAKMIGCSKQSLYKYELDIVTQIPYEMIAKIATACHTDPAYLVGWVDAPGESARHYEEHTALRELIEVASAASDDDVMLAKAVLQRLSGKETEHV